jgi:predicted nucleic acid-binding protein
LNRLSGVETVRVDAKTEADAWAWLRRHDEREYSFVDATSFAVMRRRRVREALAFDGDFNAAGLVEVRAG